MLLQSKYKKVDYVDFDVPILNLSRVSNVGREDILLRGNAGPYWYRPMLATCIQTGFIFKLTAYQSTRLRDSEERGVQRKEKSDKVLVDFIFI